MSISSLGAGSPRRRPDASLAAAAERAAAAGSRVGRMLGPREVAAFDAARKNGLTPSEMGVSRPICDNCHTAIADSGGRVLDDGRSAVWPR